MKESAWGESWLRERERVCGVIESVLGESGEKEIAQDESRAGESVWV